MEPANLKRRTVPTMEYHQAMNFLIGQTVGEKDLHGKRSLVPSRLEGGMIEVIWNH